MSTIATDILGTTALVGRAVPATWSAHVSASKARHLIASRKPMARAYGVQTTNGFSRRRSEGST